VIKNKPNFMNRKLLTLILVNMGLITACNQQPKPEVKPQPAPENQPGFVLNEATLDQADEQGRPLWNVKAKTAIYSPDKKTAKVEKIKGKLFQEGAVVLEIEADKGELENEGKKILLTGNIIAIDPRNGVILKGNEVEWIPQKELLIMRKNLIATRQKVEIKAQEGLYFTRQEQVELLGNVIGNSQENNLQLNTDHLIWQINSDKLVADKRVKITQFKEKKVTGEAVGNWAQFELKKQIVLMQKNVKLTSVDPALEITGNSILWNIKTQIVNSDQAVTIIDLKEKLKLTGNNSVVNLVKKVAFLSNGVSGFGGKNQADINCQKLTWTMETQDFIAEGKVKYSQINPVLNLSGEKALGKFQGENIVVKGNSGNRVRTEIIPEEKPKL
jgi:LPS export ABC transporter protein LptC